MRGCLVLIGVFLGLAVIGKLFFSDTDAATGPEGFDQLAAQRNCEDNLRNSMKAKGQFDPNMFPEIRSGPGKDQITFINEYESQNSFGATLTGKYMCVVSSIDGSLAALYALDAGKWYLVAGEEVPL